MPTVPAARRDQVADLFGSLGTPIAANRPIVTIANSPNCSPVGDSLVTGAPTPTTGAGTIAGLMMARTVKAIVSLAYVGVIDSHNRGGSYRITI